MEDVGSVEDVSRVRLGTEWLSVGVAMDLVHSGQGGASNAARIEQNANDSVNVEPSLGSDERHDLHDWATVIVDAQSRRDRAKDCGGSGFAVDRKDDEAVARDVHGRLASRAHMNNHVVMALVRRYFQEKMEELSVVECRWHRVLHVEGVRR